MFKSERQKFLLKKLRRLPSIQIIINECDHLIPQKHMLMEQTNIQWVERKIKCNNIVNDTIMINLDDVIK